MRAAFVVSATPTRRSNHKNNGMPTTPSGLSNEDTTPGIRRDRQVQRNEIRSASTRPRPVAAGRLSEMLAAKPTLTTASFDHTDSVLVTVSYT
jgi:hypothetical protein